ncbi:MAG: T9SS type A sorting domain-containing protein [Bacteroidetes bacterium]|nr:T9SS type A sorting domain-containing protein [Bacteroidota bacterium]
MYRPSLWSFLTLAFSAVTLSQNESIVNTTLPFAQRDPHIAADAAGNYAVVWRSINQTDSNSAGDIMLRFFGADGQPESGEIVVNTVTARDQDLPSVAMGPGGKVVVVWASHTGNGDIYDIKARRFSARMPAGNEWLVTTTTAHTQSHPAVAMDHTGRFVIAWDSWHQDGSDRGVYARVFDSSGTPLTTEIAVNTTVQNSQAKPAIRFFPDGKFIIVWESWKQDQSEPPGYAVVARLFSSSGVPLTPEFMVNTYVGDYQWFADVETFSDGSFIIAWCSWEQDGFDGGIYTQRYDAAGIKAGTETLVNQTTNEYQWLPRIVRWMDDSYAVLWSSWKQDGDREGVYLRTYAKDGRPTSLETIVPEYTTNFQWEPDAVTAADGSLRVVWSTWGKHGMDYDIAIRSIMPRRLTGLFPSSLTAHPAGTTSSALIVHRIDSTAVTGHLYEVQFDSLGVKDFRMRIIDKSDGDTVVPHYRINRGDKTFYNTPIFDGVTVEFRPVFDLLLDLNASHAVNSTGSNLLTSIVQPTIGTKLTAPIDAVLRWGSTDTLANGQYMTPKDTAINVSGQRVVAAPFIVWSVTDNSKVDLLIADANANKKYDIGERIILLTPVKYRKAANNTHAQVSTLAPAGTPLKWPGPGDSVVIVTQRPLTAADRFHFTTINNAVVGVPQNGSRSLRTFEVSQNYPNPFNPATTIRYTLPEAGNVRIGVYTITGQRVAEMNEGYRAAGSYRVQFNAQGLSSGVYFYRLEFAGRSVVRKMVLMK